MGSKRGLPFCLRSVICQVDHYLIMWIELNGGKLTNPCQKSVFLAHNA